MSLEDAVRRIELMSHVTSDALKASEDIAAFEASLASVFGARAAVAVASGTAAIHCALAALDIGPGDEVLVPSMSVVMSVAPILHQGATPVFVDTVAGRIDFDYADLREKITSRTKAVMPVYLWGFSYDLDRLTDFASEHNLAIVEDACQAHGSRWRGRYLGTWGQLGCFSMKGGKLVATDEGGFVLTDSEALAAKCRAFRSHWIDPNAPGGAFSRLAFNYRLTGIQAILGRLQVEQLDELVSMRRKQTEFVLGELAQFEPLTVYEPNPNEQPNGFSPVLLINDDYATGLVAKRLWENGVPNSVGTFGLRPVQERVCGARSVRYESTPNAKYFLDHVIALIIRPKQSEFDLEKMVRSVAAVLQECKGGRI